jgi:preprotein translocase subunit YajC
MGSVIFLAFLLIAMWIFVVLPQQRRQRAHQVLVSSLDVGDDVITTSGMYGTITELDDQSVMLAVSDGVELRMVRQAIMRKVEEGIDEPAGDDDLGEDGFVSDLTDDLPDAAD